MKKHILVVDDDQLILYALSKAFKEQAYEVETADTGTEAIEKVSRSPYDLCMLDSHLSDMNGLELKKRIKDACPETKIIIMTASCLDSSGLTENNNAAIANGACHFIPKPFNLFEVTDVVEELLRGNENSEAGFRFTGSGFEKKSRKNPRKPYKENIRFHMNVIDRGNYTRWSLVAQAVDISDRGIGLLSQYPLNESQVIGFDETMDNRTGVVVWSKMIDEENCRVGIRFA
jgi:DNA-binding response OmpR family regulator